MKNVEHGYHITATVHITRFRLWKWRWMRSSVFTRTVPTYDGMRAVIHALRVAVASNPNASLTVNITWK